MDTKMIRPATDTRSTLLHAALTCFAQHGFEGTSIRMIAKEAQRPLSLLSHHFGSKEELYLEVFKYLSEVMEAEEACDRTPVHGLPPQNRHEALCILREQIHCHYKKAVQSYCSQDSIHEMATRLWLQEMRSPRPILVPLLKEMICVRADLLKSAIRFLRPELEAGEVNFLTASLIGQVMSHGLMHGSFTLLWADHPYTGSTFQASELLVDLWLKALLGA